MTCPECGSDGTVVIDTRTKGDDSIYRRRECLNCSKRFSTRERTRQRADPADGELPQRVHDISQMCRCVQCVCKTYTNAAVICQFCIAGWHQSAARWPKSVDYLSPSEVASKGRS